MTNEPKCENLATNEPNQSKLTNFYKILMRYILDSDYIQIRFLS